MVHYFRSDCKRGADTLLDCHWVTACRKNYTSSQGVTCKVYRNSSESSKCTDFYSITTHDKLRSLNISAHCSTCTSTTSINLTCIPKEYTWASDNYDIYSFSKEDYSNPDYKLQYFVSDCKDFDYKDLNCGWVTKCTRNYSSEYNYHCESYSNLTNGTIFTRKVFKEPIDFRVEWCANCTQLVNTSVICTQCTRWVEYTKTSCRNEIRYGGSGEVGCSNCTICSNEYFACSPCTSYLGSAPALPTSSNLKLVKIRKSRSDLSSTNPTFE